MLKVVTCEKKDPQTKHLQDSLSTLVSGLCKCDPVLALASVAPGGPTMEIKQIRVVPGGPTTAMKHKSAGKLDHGQWLWSLNKETGE